MKGYLEAGSVHGYCAVQWLINLHVVMTPLYLCLSIHPFIHPSVSLSACMWMEWPFSQSMYRHRNLQSTYLSMYLRIYAFIHPSMRLYIYLPIYLSIYLSIYEKSISIQQASSWSSHTKVPHKQALEQATSNTWAYVYFIAMLGIWGHHVGTDCGQYMQFSLYDLF